MTRYDKILGGLLGGAIGDAMGAATETRTTAQIIDRFGGLVKDFIAPPDDVFAHGWPRGSVTDDFSLAYCTAEAIIRSNGVITDETAKDALISWGKTPYFVMAGPTTVACVDRLLGKPPVPNKYDFLSVDNSKGSNGSAMKISPAGLVSKGNVEKAVKNAITIAWLELSSATPSFFSTIGSTFSSSTTTTSGTRPHNQCQRGCSFAADS